MKPQILFFLFIPSFIFLSLNGVSKLEKPLTNDYYNYIAINEIMMWISNNGDGSHDPITDASGLYWPGGVKATKSAVFEDGLVWGGYVNDSIQVNGNTHLKGLQAGKILEDGSADDPNLSKYRVYKIRRNWETLPQGPERDAFERDYNEWPVEDGAPWIDVDGDGNYTPGIDEPQILGDEMLWYVSNDLDSSRISNYYESYPIGLEFQVTTFAYYPQWLLDDVVFKKYVIINKGENSVEDMIFGYWSDFDLGDPYDDYIGCDSLLNLGFGYNSDNKDGSGLGSTYGTPPPAVGYHLLQGPIVAAFENDEAYFKGQWRKGFKNLQMTSFAPIIKEWWEGMSDPFNYPDDHLPVTVQIYNMLRGFGTLTGLPLIDPHTGNSTRFGLSGDPVAGTGWYEGPGWPDGGLDYRDRRLQINVGTLNFAPGDTNEIVIAILMAIGDDYLDSVTKLKEKTRAIHDFYYTGIMSGVNKDQTIGPVKYSLNQNYPNPFNPTTIIEFTLEKSEKVQLDVFNIAGQKVKTLVNEKMKAGKQSIEFDAGNLASGIYFYQIQAGSFHAVKKMIVIK